MLAKFSVKKAYTVIVGIVLILVLGVVAATRMTTDLLPSMELPYAIIVTTYQGASPETVEMAVTKPIESSMATLNNIKNIQSSSSENYSMVMLEFNNDTNMDSSTIDIRESLDQIKGYWPDEVGNPMVIKLNPDMMPVMVAAVDADGMDAVELTDYINNTLKDELEGIDGVASATPMGTVSETVEVTINDKKLDAVNEKVKKALDRKFEDAESEISDGKRKLNKGENTLNKAKDEARDQLSKAETQLSDMKLDLLKNELQVNDALKQIISAEEEIDKAKKELTKQKPTVEKTIKDLKKTIKGLEDSIDQMETLYGQYQALVAQKAELEASLALMPDNAELNAAYQQVVGGIAAIEEGLAAQTDADGNPLTIEALPGVIKTMKSGLTEAKTGLKQAEDGLKEINKGLKDVEKNEKTIKSKKKELSKALEEITKGRTTLSEKESELKKKNAEAEEGFIEGSVDIKTGKSALDTAKDQIDDQKDTAFDSLDLTGIITESMVEGMLTAGNFSMPAGYVTDDHRDYLVRVGDKFSSLDEIKDYVLLDLSMDDLDPIKLSDIADVEIVNDAGDSYVKVNKNDGMIISLAKQTGYSTADVADRIKEKFDELSADGSGLHFVELMDQGIYINMIVSSVFQNLMLGAGLAIIILLIFLKDIRPTAIIAVSIPVSVVFAVVMMYFSGVTLNVISLSGLALGVGMLVDNSIVVIENIYRLRSLGHSRKEAAIEGAKEVTGAIAASTATTISVFAPIIFTSGLTRMLFVDMALTILYSLLASLIIAVTFVPMTASKILGKEKEKKRGLIDAITDVYIKVLDKVLNVKIIVFVVIILALCGSVVLALKNGTIMIPDMDSPQMSMTLKMPDDTVDIKETAEMSDKVIEKVLEIDDIDSVGAMVSGGQYSMLGLGGGGTDITTVSYYILCKEDKKLTNEEIARLITEKTKDFDCEITVQASTMDMSALGASGVVVRVEGKEIDKMKEIADTVADKLSKVEGLEDISNGQDDVTSEKRFHVRKDKAAEYGLTVAQVFSAVNAKLSEAKSVTTLDTGEKEYGVFVKTNTSVELDLDGLANIEIEGKKDNEKEMVKLKEIADFEDAEGLSAITRQNQNRYISVTAAIKDGYNAGLLADKVDAAINDVKVPTGYKLIYDGENETTMEAMKQVGLMMLLAVIFMYLIMVIQFQSLKSPFIIMFTLPLAFTGGFLALFIGGMEVSVIAMVGMVMLAGIIVNNGIVLVDAINQMRDRGIKKREAILESARNRIRPILMTALTTILGLTPLAIGYGMGADMGQPMAVVVIGGLIYGTLLTLFVVPCIYDLFHRKEKKIEE